MIRLALVAAIVAACGGGGKPPALPENHALPSAAAFAIRDGSYPCGFRFEGFLYGPYKCTVAGSRFTKEGGFEPFTGTLSAAGAGSVRVDAVGANNVKFSVDLAKGDDGTFRGKIAHASDAQWWLGSGDFELSKGGMGGDQYGGAGYGGPPDGGG